MRLPRYALLGVLCAMLLMSVGCTTSEPSQPAEKSGSEEDQAEGPRQIDPEADRVLKKACSTLNSANSLSFHVEGLMDEYLDTGQLVQVTRTSQVLVRRPNGLHVETEGDDVERVAWYDGKTVTVLDREGNVYASCEAPGTVHEMLDHLVEKYGLTMPAADVLFPKLHETLMANVQTVTYLGRSALGDAECHHLLFEQETIDWQLWIEAGETTVPRQLTITYKLEEGEPQYVARFSQWNLSPKVTDATFAFKLPTGAKGIQMSELLGIEEGE
ncbi:hypothetical protein ES707_14730 [subsurface metagenome]